MTRATRAIAKRPGETGARRANAEHGAGHDAGRGMGNRSVGALLRRMRAAATPATDPGLTVRPADDRFEDAAHRAAERTAPDRPQPAGGRAPPPARGPRPRGGAPVDAETGAAIRRGFERGRPLSAHLRRSLEPRFGVDLSGIRLHSDRRAAEVTRGLGATAATVGRTIWLDPARCAVETRSGQAVLRHEIAHAVQQSGVRRPGRPPTLGRPSAPVVQCLITVDDMRAYGGAPSSRGKYKALLGLVEQWHAIAGDAADAATRRQVLHNAIEAQARKYIAANEGAGGRDKQRKVAAARALIESVDWDRGRLQRKPDRVARFDAWRDAVRALPEDAADDMTYVFNIHAVTGHERYDTFAIKRSRMKAMQWFTRKTGGEIKDEAAREVADEFTEDWQPAPPGTDDTPRARKERKEDYVAGLMAAGVGHTWVSFHTETSTGQTADARSFGLYPGATGDSPFDAVPGRVSHPETHSATEDMARSRRVPVPFDRWKTGLKFAYDQYRSPKDYSLLEYNCTRFAKDVADHTGVPFPAATWLTPTRKDIWSPTVLRRNL